MRPVELAEALRQTVAAKLPVLIKGAPGIGKSDIVTQAAEALEADLVITHPVVSDPTDFKGLPAVVDGAAEFLPFGDLRSLIEAKRLTICFLDDLGQAPPVVQAAAMQLILARRVNGHQISDQVVFLAATNRREDRAGVTAILEPVKSRFAAIVELTPNVDDWCAWALDNDVPAEVVAFIRWRPELLMATDPPTADIVNRPCPRTWTFLGKLYAAGVRNAEVFAGAVGEGPAAEFVGFLRVWQDLPSIDGILLEPSKAKVPTEPAALYAVSVALAQRATKANAARVVKYASRLPAEFGVLCLRDVLRKCPAAANNRAFISWATLHKDVLL